MAPRFMQMVATMNVAKYTPLNGDILAREKHRRKGELELLSNAPQGVCMGYNLVFRV